MSVIYTTRKRACVVIKVIYVLEYIPTRYVACSAYELCFCDRADWEGCFGQLYNGRTGTPARPMHRSQQPIRIGYTELVIELVITICGPSCTFLEIIFPCWVQCFNTSTIKLIKIHIKSILLVNGQKLLCARASARATPELSLIELLWSKAFLAAWRAVGLALRCKRFSKKTNLTYHLLFDPMHIIHRTRKEKNNTQ